jgi:hypothetical protein
MRGAVGMGSGVLEPNHPERKGVVERHIGYLETSWLPGRSFSGVDDSDATAAVVVVTEIIDAADQLLPHVGLFEAGS